MPGKLVVRDHDCVFPDRYPYARPEQYRPPAEVHHLYSDGLRLEGWLLRPERPDWRGVVLHSHGNAQNVSAHLELVAFLARAGFAVFAVDYRGFGHSQGDVSLAGARRDVVAAGRYLREQLPGQRLVQLGQSMGAVMAALAATELRPDVLVLEAGFISYPHLYGRRYPDAQLELSLTDRVDEALLQLDCPVGLVHGTADDVVPFAYQVHFDQVLTGRPHWRLDLRGEGHLTVLGGEHDQLYKDTLIRWLAGEPVSVGG